jgi:hypothetical protein
MYTHCIVLEYIYIYNAAILICTQIRPKQTFLLLKYLLLLVVHNLVDMGLFNDKYLTDLKCRNIIIVVYGSRQGIFVF